MNDQVDEFAGLPMLSVFPFTIRYWHPKSPPFGDEPLRQIAVTVNAPTEPKGE
jgi:hypothetical protein